MYSILGRSSRNNRGGDLTLNDSASRSPRGVRRFTHAGYILGAAFVIWWLLNIEHSHHLDPPPMRWGGGRRRTPGEPTYDRIKAWERQLPQHNLSLPLPEGGRGRFVRFSNNVHATGWNNVLHDYILCAHLAYESKRAYVFPDYEWTIAHWPWPRRIWPLYGSINPRTPLSALLGGPMVGGRWEDDDDAPRAVGVDWWDTVCANPNDVQVIYTNTIKHDIGDAPGDQVLDKWARVLREEPKRCVDIRASPEDGYPQVFDLWLVGSPRIIALWERFRTSPIARLLTASPLVHAAVVQNEYLFQPHGLDSRRGPRSPYDRMMAVHLRRGDYWHHCQQLARWSSSYFGWNQLPSLPDHFEPPPNDAGWGKNTPENTALYMKKCWPTIPKVLEKVREARAEWVRDGVGREGESRVLDVMFVLSNGDETWLGELKTALHEEGWSTVVTSKDMELNSDQIGVSMEVDMEIAKRAAVFIGNGWSSFTSSVVSRRLVIGKEGPANRFW